jgi:shikimate kinase
MSISPPADVQSSENIILIGMPGSGKSTIGRAIASSKQLDFVDSDDVIVARCGVDIATIFEIEGEAGFRQREQNVIADLCRERGLVLATGGGAILSAETRARLRANGLVVYLRVSLDELAKRTSRDRRGDQSNRRPLLQNGDIRERLQTLMTIRAPLYESTAHITVDVETANRSKTLSRVLHVLQGFPSSSDVPRARSTNATASNNSNSSNDDGSL